MKATLKELHGLVKKTQVCETYLHCPRHVILSKEHRIAAETTITNIHHAQDKMKNEAKGIPSNSRALRDLLYLLLTVSTYLKDKLKTLYQNGIEDARKEAE